MGTGRFCCDNLLSIEDLLTLKIIILNTFFYHVASVKFAHVTNKSVNYDGIEKERKKRLHFNV